MHRIDGPGATVDNTFTEGDPVGGIQATVVTDDWLNDVQEELMSILAAGGVSPVKGIHNQVLAAIRKVTKSQLGSYANVASVGVATTLTVADLGKVFSVFANVPITLPLIATLSAGDAITFVTNTGFTLQAQGTNNITSGAQAGLTSIVFTVGETVTVTASPTGTWYVTSYSRNAIKTIVVQTFTASGTYTPSPNMKYAKVRQVAGGGGGAGSTGGGGGSSAGGGGQSGGYNEKTFTAAQIGASQTVTIGAAGLLGNGGAPGGNGGTTSLGALLACTGGSGGNPGANNATISLNGTGGAALGTASGGDVNVPGEPGGNGLVLGGANGGWSGFGGGNPFSGRAPQAGPTSAGAGPTGRGGGGSGGTATTVSTTGGAGGAGFMEITEYCS